MPSRKPIPEKILVHDRLRSAAAHLTAVRAYLRAIDRDCGLPSNPFDAELAKAEEHYNSLADEAHESAVRYFADESGNPL